MIQAHSPLSKTLWRVQRPAEKLANVRTNPHLRHALKSREDKITFVKIIFFYLSRRL